MSNHDDFWTSLAAGHTNTVLAGAMDSHLSGKSIDESFGSVRTLTDIHRQANALALPVEAGTKVAFAGGLGAHMSYDDVPADGITGEVVTVKSATGEITHHGGKVFVKWADGKFRPIHAEHLRLAGSKTAASLFEKMLKQMYGLDPDDGAGEFVDERIQRSRNKREIEDALLDYGSRYDLDRVDGKYASGIKAQFEKIKDMAEKRPDSKFLKSLLKQMADKGFAPTEKQMAVVKKIEDEIKQQGEMKKELKGLDKGAGFDASTIGERKGKPVQMDDEDKDTVGNFGQGEHHDLTEVAQGKTATFRVASLGDLTDFLKVANGTLVHKSTKDLWSFNKDADGNFLVSRLFDDEGEPLKV